MSTPGVKENLILSMMMQDSDSERPVESVEELVIVLIVCTSMIMIGTFFSRVAACICSRGPRQMNEV